MSVINCPTPHISAENGDFAKTVLMPGDPKRASFIASSFLTDTKLVNDVRGIKGYTGKYKGTDVSVMASGMGMPSMGIYSHELYNVYGVENIIRVGSAGAISEKIKVMDIIIVQGASTDSNFATQYRLPGTFSAIADYSLLRSCADKAETFSFRYHVGNIVSSDSFYNDNTEAVSAWSKMGVLAVEMEAAALYMTAARFSKRALAICTVSDNIITGEALNSQERETLFTQMIELALETATDNQ